MAFRTNKTPVLQEKSASGSVASFNTALAMPLASCNIAVNAYQEGSGDPSPVNVRNIVPYNKLRINMVDFNQYINEVDTYDTPQTINGVTISRIGNAFNLYGDCSITQQPSGINISSSISRYTVGHVMLAVAFKSGWDGDTTNWRIYKSGTGSVIYCGNSEYRFYRVPNNWSGGQWSMVIPFVDTKHYDFTFYPQVFDLTQMFGESVATYLMTLEQNQRGVGYELFKKLFYKDFYAYNVGGNWVSVASVNGDNYPDYAEVNLGQDVYGGVLDVVTGVLRVTHTAVDLGDYVYDRQPATGGYYYFYSIFDNRDISGNNNLCEIFQYKGASANVLTGDWQFSRSDSNTRFFFRADSITNGNDFRNAVSGYKIFYPLATPFDIQLTPTQIETIIGDNTIFADTGNIDLTYKDLDIAKRGNLREVFKLPS